MRARMEKESPSPFLFNAMTPEEYERAKKLYKFLIKLSECKHGFLNISREEFIDLASTIMKCSSFEAYQIIMKMKKYGWIREIKDDLVIINIG